VAHGSVNSRAAAVASLAVISPHLDDAVMGCGELIARYPGSTVITVCAGMPESSGLLTPWDARCGFRSSREAMLARRSEDRAAVRRLAAEPVHLSALDGQYGEPLNGESILADLEDRCGDRVVVGPLGLFHADHERVGEVFRALCHRRSGRRCLVYAEALYRSVDGGATVHDARRAWATDGLALRPLQLRRTEAARNAKRQAVGCYQSQNQALRQAWPAEHLDVNEPEWLFAVSPVR